ncbi:MAG: hypothetical protein Q4C47_06455 [Planctomycetia bacterium]|nr:hypothetical protein [Planctomycetia bacterium]
MRISPRTPARIPDLSRRYKSPEGKVPGKDEAGLFSGEDYQGVV